MKKNEIGKLEFGKPPRVRGGGADLTREILWSRISLLRSKSKKAKNSRAKTHEKKTGEVFNSDTEAGEKKTSKN